MAGQYDDAVLQQINENVDLLGYVSQQMDLTQRGGDWFGHCPLHIDKTPSFSITPANNSYYCFSCGRGGGVLGYLMDYEGLRFDEAVEKAAKLADVDLSKMCRSETIQFLRKLKAWSHRQTQPFEHKIIPYSVYESYPRGKVTEWLEEGIEQEVLDLFDVRIDEDNNRIIYPVCDQLGRLINIKARTRYKNYKELRIPKYINYYQVGVMDYFQSLNLTYPEIRNKNEVIVFESVKSVMKAYGWGCKNCVSAEKHTLTREQIILLAKLRANVVFAYDSDISYRQRDVRLNLEQLRPITNVYVIEDKEELLGGVAAKSAPVDCGRETWMKLYENRRKVV